MARQKCVLSDLLPEFHTHPQCMININVSERRPMEDLPEFAAAVADVETKLGDGGRVLIRYSGTELKARVMVEGLDEELVESSASFLAETLEKALSGTG